MKEESGRSMIEIIGVLAIGLVMIVAAYNMYRSIDNRQKRLTTSETIADIAKKIKIMYEFSGYADISVEDLIDAGAISDTHIPVGTGWELSAPRNGEVFHIKLLGLSYDECEYFVLKHADWADRVIANNGSCQRNNSNSVQFTAK